MIRPLLIDSKAHNILKQRNYALNYFIDGYFSEINNTIEILADNKDVQDLPWIDAQGRQRVLNLYKSLTVVNRNISFIYSGYENKELLINNYTPPEGFDPTVRPWYQSAMAVKPKLSTGLPYQEIKSKEWLFSTSKALFSENHGYTGVISSDSSIDMVMKELNKLGQSYKTSYSFVTTLDGEIILHHNSNYLKKKLSEIAGAGFDMDSKGGSLVYRIGDIEKIGYYSCCQETEWLIFTIVEKGEIIKSIMWQILVYFLLTGLIAVLLGFNQSRILSQRFSTPMYELRKKVESIVRGDSETDLEYSYPENEIGTIALEIGQLTEHELYIRSKRLADANLLLEQKNDELEKLYVTDRLTGVYNRHKLDAELEKELQRSARYDKSFSIIIFDVDWFKKVNDTFGHLAGDSVLQEISILLKNNLRVMDTLGRWGGEEFLILCPETNIEQARALGDRVRTSVERHQFSINSRVTVSVGIAEFTGKEKSDDLIRRVDKNLYLAKHNGRNRVVAI